MNKMVLAVVVAVSFSGGAFASDKALGSLESASLYPLKDIVLPAPASSHVKMAAVRRSSRLNAGSINSFDSVLGPLMTAVKSAQRDEVQEMGYYLDLYTYPANTKLSKILADITQQAPNESSFNISSGDRAVNTFVQDLNYAAANETENANASSAIIAQNLRNVAAAAKKAFIGSNRFVKVQLAAHAVQEDGDCDNNFLIAQEKDGTLRVLAYTRNPF